MALCLVLVKSKAVLDLVHHTATGSSVNVLVLGAADLVAEFLSSGLVVVGLSLAGDGVTSSGDALLGLVEGGLGGVGSHLLLGLDIVRRGNGLAMEGH